MDYLQKKQYLIDVFEDTMNIMEEDKTYQNALKNSIETQMFIAHNDVIEIPDPFYIKDCKVLVSKKRTMEAAKKYAEEGYVTCVLNFASATTPGGGVKSGTTAQEECLCRVSDLLPCLETDDNIDKFYNPHRMAKDPLHNDDIIYTRDVVVVKNDVYELLDDPFFVDVITCAAPNLKKKPTNQYNHSDGDCVKISDSELFDIHLSRARKILQSAISNDVEALVLGAFGCGVFKNNPNVVAQAYKKAISEYSKYFSVVEFAIYCKQYETENYDAFKNVFK